MSFRNTFVTDFIYQASDETRDANKEVEAVFREYAAVISSVVDNRGYGYYAGWFKTLSGTLHEAEETLRPLIHALGNATKISFRLTILLESEAHITYEIRPK